jgi:hypothetical protein
MKIPAYQKILLCTLIFLICGFFTAAHTTNLIAPLFLSGRSFEARSLTIQNAFTIVFSLGFSVAYFLFFKLLWNTLHFDKVFQRIYHFLYPKITPWIPRIENSPWFVRGIVILLLLIGLIILAVQIKIIVFPYQLELREGAIQLSTHALLNGINPYALANNPIYINGFGVLYNLLILPFAVLFGNSLQLHRLINALLILGQLLLMARVMRLQKTGWLSIFIAVLFMWVGQLFLASPTARPDTLGQFLFLLTLFIPLIYKFNTPYLLISVFLGILSFYTKAYFFLGVIIVASYLFFFISKRKAMLYAAITGVFLLISILVINIYLETYFVNTLFNLFTGRFSGNYTHLLKQTIKFIQDYWGLLLIGIGVVLKIINITWISIFIKTKINFKNIDSPLLSFNMDFLLYTLIITSSLVFFLLGTNSGTFQTYFYHLITPFFVMLMLIFIDKRKEYRNWFMLLSVLTLLTQTYQNLKPDFLPFENPDWLKLEARISKAKLVLNSPLDVSILIEQGKPVAMSGFTQYFFLYPSKSFFQSMDIEKMKAEGMLYVSQIASKIRNKEYDFLETIQNENYEIFLIGSRLNPLQSDPSFISDYYHLVETLTLPMPHSFEEWKIGIWEPN